MSWLTRTARRVRGILGAALWWAVIWVVVGLPVFAIGLRLGPAPPGGVLVAPLLLMVPFLAAYGFVSGLGFGLFFTLAERRRQFRDLSMARTAIWGAAGGLVPLAIGVVEALVTRTRLTDGLPLGIAVLAVSGVFAATSFLLMARRAARLEPGDAVPLIEEERSFAAMSIPVRDAVTQQPES